MLPLHGVRYRRDQAGLELIGCQEIIDVPAFGQYMQWDGIIIDLVPDLMLHGRGLVITDQDEEIPFIRMSPDEVGQECPFILHGGQVSIHDVRIQASIRSIWACPNGVKIFVQVGNWWWWEPGGMTVQCDKEHHVRR